MKYRLPPLHALRAFEAVARHMSFKKAADELCVTPAAVSHHVRSLEEYLGVELIKRLNRSMELTEHGNRCFSGVSEGFACLSRAMTWVGDEQRDTQRLVITAGPAFTAKWLAPRLPKFIELHPEVQPRMSASLAFCDFAKDGIDVAVRFGHVEPKGLYVQRLVEESVVPMCNPSLLADGRSEFKPADLVGMKLIHDESLKMVEPTSPGWAEWLTEAGVRGIDPTQGMRFNHADHALQAAIDGTGVVLGRRILAAPDINAGRLAIPFGPEIPSGLYFHFVCPLSKARWKSVQLFRDWITEELNQDWKGSARRAESAISQEA